MKPVMRSHLISCRPVRALARLALIAPALLTLGLRAAPLLGDPTQPPEFTSAANSQAGARSAATAAAATAGMVPLPHQLQAVQISAHGNSTALIDSQLVRVGDVLGDATVRAIDAEGVSLRGPHYAQRLALTPGGTKTPSASAHEISITRSGGSFSASPVSTPPSPPSASRQTGLIKESP